ncbi:MAG: TldD/PmbA family protein [Firmicutes bacterium]|nr:TldD/PmbA family protein [Bacillota bacterium]
MNQDQFIGGLLKAAQAAGIAEAEVYLQREESMRVLVRENEIDEYAVNTSGGLSLRGLFSGKMGAAYTEVPDDAAVSMLVTGVKESASLITDEDEQFIFAGSPSYASVDCVGELGSPAARVEMSLALDRLGRSLDPRVKELGGMTGLQTTKETIRIVNTHGLNLSHTGTCCVGFIEAVAREGDRVTTGFMLGRGLGLSDIHPEDIAREAVEEAVFQLSASPCVSGEIPVILRHTAMADLLDTFAGVFSADAAQKDLSLLKGKEGEIIAASCVTLVDDPLYRGGMATRPFDAEGVATFVKNVIDGGVLTTLLHNLKTAQKAGCPSTGNAARGGYKGVISVSPTNFYIKPGQRDIAAMTAAMGSGLVITGVEGLHAGANEVSGDFSLLAQGYLVENGQAGRPVEQVTVAGNFFTLLMDIVEVGNDLRPSMGTVLCPSVRVKALSVAGE